MKTAFLVGGPLIVSIGFGVYSGVVSFGDVDGLEHQSGVEAGGTFALEHQETYQCDEEGSNCVLIDSSTELSEIDGLEIEQEPIEYREGDELTTVRKLNGLNKYANITLRRPTGFDWKSWRFMFEREAAIEAVNQEYDEKLQEMEAEAETETRADAGIEGEIYQIEPPRLIIPAN